MANIQPNITITGETWIDVYSAASLPSSTQVSVQNVGRDTLRYTIAASQPPANHNAYRLLKSGELVNFDDADSKIWFFCAQNDGLINVSRYRPELDQYAAAFGEFLAEQSQPILQLSAQYGLLDEVLRIEGATGTTNAVDSMFICSTGIDPSAIASITSQKQAIYRAGQGLKGRFTAVFSQGFANSTQAAGFVSSENGFQFGYLGETFGIAYTSGGKTEAQELTLTGAATGAEVATVTINGSDYSVNLTAASTDVNAYEIASQLNVLVPNYIITSNGSTVVAVNLLAGPQAAFSFSSATATGNWSQTVAGQDFNVDFTPQSSWNRNTCDWLDPTKGNVYQIQFEYLGFGGIAFYVENPKTSKFELVHLIEYSNLYTLPSVTNPAFRIGWVAQNTGNTNNITLKGASAGAFIEGKIYRDSPSRSLTANAINIGTTPTTIMALRNRTLFGGKLNRADIYPLLLTAATDANKAAFFQLIADPVFTQPITFNYVNKDRSIVEYSLDNVSYTNGVVIGGITVTANQSQKLEFNTRNDLNTIIASANVIAVVASVSSGAAASMQLTATWLEDY